MRNVTMLFIVALMIFVGVETSDGNVIVTDPEQIMAPNDGTVTFLKMSPGAALMEDIMGVDTPVTLEGDDQCFVFFGENSVGLGGYLTIDSSGWGIGPIYKDIFLEGSSPDFVVVLLDRGGGRFGEVDDKDEFWSDFGVGVWETGLGLIGAGGIEYAGVLGGFTDIVFVLQNPSFFEDLGNIVLVVPEPATIVLACAGIPFLLRRRVRRRK